MFLLLKYLFIYTVVTVNPVVADDSNRVVLEQCKDYRPSARGYINASLVTVSFFVDFSLCFKCCTILELYY